MWVGSPIPTRFQAQCFRFTWGAAAMGRCAYQHVPPFLPRDAQEGSVLEDLAVTSFPLHGVEISTPRAQHMHRYFGPLDLLGV